MKNGGSLPRIIGIGVIDPFLKGQKETPGTSTCAWDTVDGRNPFRATK